MLEENVLGTTMNKKKKTDTHCFAPGCRSGYPGHRVENGRKISLFSAPKDEDRRKVWERNLKRKDKPLTDTSAVCEKHFADHFVVRDYVHIIGGKEVRIARGKPGLTANAVPTFLPDLPAYLSTSVKKPRPERKRCLVSTSGSAKKVRLSRRDEHEASLLGEENSDPNTSPAENMQANPLKSGDLRDLATCLSVPRLWTKLTTPDLDLLVYATTRTTKQPFSVSHEKVICFSLDSNSDVVASCYLGAREKKYGKITSLLEATNIFQEVDTALLCSSAMSKDAYDGLAQNLTEKMKRTLTPASDGVFSKNCLGMVTVKGTICVHCRYLRKSLLARKSKLKKKRVTHNLSHKLRMANQKTKRIASRLCTLAGQVRAMKEENSRLSDETFLGRIKELPPKQQEAALHMFKAAKRKSVRGMRYSKEWILECLIMRMKGPKLYEDMRRQKVLVLPSKVTLQKYLRSYRTGFGFNAKVMSMLKQKASSMDAFKRHGGLIVDEIKLSENLSVSSSGHIQGFVDMGQFTPSSDKHKVADHGMVIMFVPFTGEWTQILASFATQGNMKGNLLSKVMLEAVILAEKAGLFVDFITSDGATWNRNMWSTMGIYATASSTNCKVQHPVDNKRSFHF